MFLGTYSPRLDEKGRLILPAKFREQLAGGVVLTKGQERCLTLWTAAGFEAYRDDLAGLPVTSKKARDYSRVLFAGASDEIPDRQGRITIPQALRDYAGLDRDCVVVGTNTQVEIWDAQTWATYLAEQEQAFADISEEVAPPQS